MQSQAIWIDAALVLNAIASLILLWRLWSEGLARQYSFLTLVIFAELAQMLILLPVRSHTLYTYLYYVSTPILWILYYAVVLELYRLILEDYPGISSAGRKAVTWAMGLGILISAASAIPGFSHGTGQFPRLRIFFAVERSVVLVLLLFLVLIQLFLFRYHLRLSRNRLIYSTGYALYFGVTVSSDIILTGLLGGQVYVPFSIAVGIAGALILLAGAVLLTREGEACVIRLDAHDTASERLRLQQQLVDMNRMLTKVARGS
jgi:hypothetical protein